MAMAATLALQCVGKTKAAMGLSPESIQFFIRMPECLGRAISLAFLEIRLRREEPAYLLGEISPFAVRAPTVRASSAGLTAPSSSTLVSMARVISRVFMGAPQRMLGQVSTGTAMTLALQCVGKTKAAMGLSPESIQFFIRMLGSMERPTT